MALKYEPAVLKGGSSVLPYSFDPPIDGVENNGVSAFSFNRSILPYITKVTVLLAISFYTVASVFISGNPDNLLYEILFPVLGALFSLLALRGRIPSMLIAAFAGLPVLVELATGIAPILIFIILLLSLYSGVKKRFSRGSATRGIDSNDENLSNLKESMIPVWGSPGAHIAANSEFGEAGQLGARGEILVGEALEKFAKKYPHVRIFHGICFTPGRSGADIDHVALIGDEVFLIDAKFWSHGSYTWNRSGEVMRDGKSFNGGKVHMDAALEKWEEYLGRSARSITSLVCMVQDRKGTYDFPSSQSSKRVTLTTLPQLIETLSEAAKKSHPVVDRGLVYSTAVQLQ